MTLPTNIRDLTGLRAARWVRESTADQFKRYGPDAQQQLISGAIKHLGLKDSGLVWKPARSGRTVYQSAEMAAMIEAARAGRFKVLIVAYVARFQRNLRQTLNVLEEDLHPAGVAVYFVDEEILSSNERDWDNLVDEAKGADSWQRKHRRRVTEGIAAKLATKRDPGGHPPYGFRRNTAKLVEPDPSRMPTVVEAFNLAAMGATDRTVAATVGVPLFTIRGMLTSPLYIGRLRDQRPANWPPVVSMETWNAVQNHRQMRATNAGRPAAPGRNYALTGLIKCGFCGRRLIGDTNRYRHPDACAAFRNATPEWPTSRRGRRDGKSYPRDVCEDIVAALLAGVRLDEATISRVVSRAMTPDAGPDEVALARIKRARRLAANRFVDDQDVAALQAVVARLEAEEAEARRVPRGDGIPADFIVKSLKDLSAAWSRAEDGQGRRSVAASLFSEIRLRGLKGAEFTLTDRALARGLAAVLPERVELFVGYGRGERIGPDSLRMIVRVMEPDDRHRPSIVA